ncbi:hypothetical protein Efla_005822 [Eimeria flavescens]
MSFGELIQDAAAWVSEEIRKSIDDLVDEGPVEPLPNRQWREAASQQRPQRTARQITKVVALDMLSNCQVDFVELTSFHARVNDCFEY